MNKNILTACDKLMRYLHTLNVHYVHVHNVHYASLRSNNKTNLPTTPVVIIGGQSVKLNMACTEASRVPALQIEHIWKGTNVSLELWSLTQSNLDLTFNYVALPARWCTTQSKKATDAFPWGLAASSNILLTFIAYIIYKYIFDIIIWLLKLYAK